ncbi:hypothetical protein LNP24_11935 [Klebsiella pneumoniae subsp. pneumoniae]|nr:hypothetical protein [Klebsiella pneumoniae subsp. pneumoniae]
MHDYYSRPERAGRSGQRVRVLSARSTGRSALTQTSTLLRLAHNPEMRLSSPTTTEAGISYHAGDRFDDAPPVGYPAKLTRLLFERYQHFAGAADRDG